MTAAGEVGEGQGHRSLPVYQLHYAVYYNSSPASEADEGFTMFDASTVVPDAGDQKASNVCARHYAETFLIRLFSLELWLNELCAAQQPFSPRVIAHTIVVVRVYGALVSMIPFALLFTRCGSLFLPLTIVILGESWLAHSYPSGKIWRVNIYSRR